MRLKAEQLEPNANVVRVRFTEDGNWTCPENINRIWIEAVGGGSGGEGGYPGDHASNPGIGGRGGSSAKESKFYKDVVPGTTYAVVIGTGGTGGAGGVSVGGNPSVGSEGTATTFDGDIVGYQAAYKAFDGTVDIMPIDTYWKGGDRGYGFGNYGYSGGLSFYNSTFGGAGGAGSGGVGTGTTGAGGGAATQFGPGGAGGGNNAPSDSYGAGGGGGSAGSAPLAISGSAGGNGADGVLDIYYVE